MAMRHRWIAVGLAVAVMVAPSPPPDLEAAAVSPAVSGPYGQAPGGTEGVLARAVSQTDTLYKAARRALNQAEYKRAVELFREARRAEPEYAADALYYEAFALYRLGGRSNYEAALGSLQQQLESYPDAATHGDAEELMIRLEGELARRGDREAAERLAREAEHSKQEQMTEGREAEIKVIALQALLMSDQEKALPALRKVLTDRRPETAELRAQAVFILAQHESEETLDLMLDVVRNDPDPEVKEHAVYWLSQVDDPRAVDATLAVINDPDVPEDLKGQAIFALGQTDDPRAERILRDYAARDDVDPEVRGMAIHGLASRASPENAAFLKELFDQVRDPELRDQILFALVQSPEAVDGQWLLAVFRDESQDPEVRQMALFMAGQTGAVDAGVLAGMYDAAETREMKEQILFTLQQSGGEAGLEKMFDIARNESDLELREAAIFWIGQSGDPRAHDVLLEILQQ